MARGVSKKLPPDSMLYRAGVARMLNRIMGTTRFDAWNIDQVPVEDLTELQLSLKWLEELE